MFFAVRPLFVLILLAVFLLAANAQTSNVTGEAIARKVYNPLSELRGLLTLNDIYFDVDAGPNTLSFQLQPVWAFRLPQPDVLVIPRLTLPYREGANVVSNSDQTVWGLSDVTLDLYLSLGSPPGDWKWGVGPHFSFDTSEAPELAAIGNGIGFRGIISGAVTEDLNLALIAGNTWSYDGTRSVTTVQPYFVYFFGAGMYLGYFRSTTIDWNGNTQKINLPVGASVGGAFLLGKNGYGVDVSLGGYSFPIKTDAFPTSILSLGLSLIFPN